MQGPPKFTHIGIFGLKTNHLATLASTDRKSHLCKRCSRIRIRKVRLEEFARQGCQILKPKMQNWENFWMVLQWKMLAYFMAIWSIALPFGKFLWKFGKLYGYSVYFFPVLVCFTKKNLATLVCTTFLVRGNKGRKRLFWRENFRPDGIKSG
jgi:hypothetical protein